MNRTAVIGCGGSGKTTIANRIGEVLDASATPGRPVASPSAIPLASLDGPPAAPSLRVLPGSGPGEAARPLGAAWASWAGACNAYC